MQRFSYLKYLSCSNCDKTYSADQIQTYCNECQAPIMPVYDLSSIQNSLDRDLISTRSKSMWRWFELLPVLRRENIVSLGEGDTPLIRIDHSAHGLGIHTVFLKDESQNPTGSFKSRGMSTAVSKAKELGINQIVIPSAGNAGGALAAYSARAGMKAIIYMPKNSPAANIIESRIMDAKVELIDGLIDLAGKFAAQKSSTEGWFNMSTFKEPYRVEGKKVMGYEIAEKLHWKLPDVIIYPTGGGTGLIGMWKAFQELKELGWLEKNILPRMVVAQANGCAPVIRAFNSGLESCDYWENAHTIATGLCVPKSFADKEILKVLRESKGTAVGVSDSEIIQAQKKLAQQEGLFTCPEGAATLTALEKLIKQGKIDQDETVLLFNTGTGLKYLDKLVQIYE